tara:strand:- start:42 stop:284 length:243 start_codon:yes stop_codon:yes gene_type:complete
MKIAKTRLKQIIKEEHAKIDSVGKVLWHSLNESGQIGAYDVKFGQTIVKNILAEDLEPTVVTEHMHPAQRDDDQKRGNLQ